ncbi:hypothetical protein TWF696_004245 [Orbilia brochopaga]|uniref:RNA helicase n=1 Tax=Orbilia brochopaga TaxID=3140254 RepID=A0AAV9V8P4_9PEZI
MTQTPSKRCKLQTQKRVPPTVPPPSASDFLRVRRQHKALQASLRSDTDQGFHTRFESHSPEPFLARTSHSTKRPKRATPDSAGEAASANGEISDVEAIKLRRKNEKARKRRERKRKRQQEKEQEAGQQDGGDDGGYSSWSGISDSPPPDQEKAEALMKLAERLMEEDEEAPLDSPTIEALMENGIDVFTRSPSASPSLARKRAGNKRRRTDTESEPESGKTTSTEFPSPKSQPTEEGPEAPLIEVFDEGSLFESPEEPLADPGSPSASTKSEGVWETLWTDDKPAQEGDESIGSSRPSLGSVSSVPLQNSDTSNVTIGSEEKASHDTKPAPSTTDETPIKPATHQKARKAVSLKARSKAQLEVGNDSTAGLVDPLTPNPPKAQHKSREQISQELQAVRRKLPIWNFQDEIRSIMSTSDTMVLVGETGSGKSTQIGQFLLNEPWVKRRATALGDKFGGCIAITQPRRVAAISLAQRVSSEMGTHLGKAVGYCVRFDNLSEPSTKIRYLTDGMLLNEILHDPELSRYSAVVVDEAHERSVSTDLGLGLLKGIIAKRQKKNVPLKVIVMSATLDVDRMADFLGASPAPLRSTTDDPVPAPICRIPGKLYPVETFYTPTEIIDFQTAALKTIFQVHYQYPCPGDILVFSTGSEEIEDLASTLQEFALQMEEDKPKMQVLKLYASLDPAEQQKVFTKGDPNVRRVIIATNIAETSVTVPGVRHVIDCGKVKIKQFRHQLGIESLLVTDISQASAQQRKGRAGREGPGTCYRLYTEPCYHKLAQNSDPEILHCNLSSAVLTLKARGVLDVFNFPYLDRPNRYSFEKALLGLNLLDALDDAGKITKIGLKMAKFPLPPIQSRVIIAASEAEEKNTNPAENVLVDVIDVLSCLSVEGSILLQPTRWKKPANSAMKPLRDPLLPNMKKNKKRKRPVDDESDEEEDMTVEEKVHTKRMEIIHPSGDHITYLNILRRYLSKRSNEQKRFCEEYQVSYPLMRKVENIRKQLRGYCRLDKVGDLPRESEMKYESETMVASYPRVSEEQTEKILKCFLLGLGVQSVARRVAGGKYKGMTANGSAESGMDVSVHPSSCLMWERHAGSDSKRAKMEDGSVERRREGFGEAVMYQDIVWTSKAYMKVVSKIKVAWLDDCWVHDP